jgi:queuine tRNA-ribosyltransferase
MATKFNLIATNKESRAGILETAHGIIETPVFMPVGTRATVKAMTPEQLKTIGAQIILGNTYHLMLRPGAERVARFGGLHKFMNWDLPILTDSGGFQVMSLSSLRKITESGVEFRSHIDGEKILLTPELSTEIQHLLGSDITMIFDECPSYPIDYEGAKKSMQLSLRWAERSRATFKKRELYGQFGIVQGSTYEDLRIESARNLVDMDFEGYAVGGLAVGEGQEEMFKVLDYTTKLLPTSKPRYLMGVGKPSDIIGAVKRGVDMFDCVIPTRSGRNGQAFTSIGTVNIRNSRFADDKSSLDEKCDCYSCINFSKGYIHHLVKMNEILGSVLMTQHNLRFFQNLMKDLRKKIINGEDF